MSGNLKEVFFHIKQVDYLGVENEMFVAFNEKAKPQSFNQL